MGCPKGIFGFVSRCVSFVHPLLHSNCLVKGKQLLSHKDNDKKREKPPTPTTTWSSPTPKSKPSYLLNLSNVHWMLTWSHQPKGQHAKLALRCSVVLLPLLMESAGQNLERLSMCMYIYIYNYITIYIYTSTKRQVLPDSDVGAPERSLTLALTATMIDQVGLQIGIAETSGCLFLSCTFEFSWKY